MYPIPSPNTLNSLRNTKRTRNTHQNEEPEPTKTGQALFGATLNGGEAGGGGGGGAWRIPHTVTFLIIGCIRLNLGRNTNWAMIFIIEH